MEILPPRPWKQMNCLPHGHHHPRKHMNCLPRGLPSSVLLLIFINIKNNKAMNHTYVLKQITFRVENCILLFGKCNYESLTNYIT